MALANIRKLLTWCIGLPTLVLSPKNQVWCSNDVVLKGNCVSCLGWFPLDESSGRHFAVFEAKCYKCLKFATALLDAS